MSECPHGRQFGICAVCVPVLEAFHASKERAAVSGVRCELQRVLDELREHRPGCARLEPLGCAEAHLRGLLERL